MSMCIRIAKSRANFASRSWAPAFFCKYTHKIALSLVTCPYAFRLCRLAQSLRGDFFLILGPGIFPWVSTAQARTNSASHLGDHFFCKFSRKTGLVTCPCAMRLRKLAQTLRRHLGPVNFRVKLLVSHVHVHFDCTSSHKKVVPLLVAAITILQEFHGARLEVSVIYEDLDRGPVEILVRRCCEDPDEFLSQVLA